MNAIKVLFMFFSYIKREISYSLCVEIKFNLINLICKSHGKQTFLYSAYHFIITSTLSINFTNWNGRFKILDLICNCICQNQKQYWLSEGSFWNFHENNPTIAVYAFRQGVSLFQISSFQPHPTVDINACLGRGGVRF